LFSPILILTEIFNHTISQTLFRKKVPPFKYQHEFGLEPVYNFTQASRSVDAMGAREEFRLGGPAGAFEQKITVSAFALHNRMFL
jgi:hypothetical protein